MVEQNYLEVTSRQEVQDTGCNSYETYILTDLLSKNMLMTTDTANIVYKVSFALHMLHKFGISHNHISSDRIKVVILKKNMVSKAVVFVFVELISSHV